MEAKATGGFDEVLLRLGYLLTPFQVNFSHLEVLKEKIIRAQRQG